MEKFYKLRHKIDDAGTLLIISISNLKKKLKIRGCLKSALCAFVQTFVHLCGK